MQRSYAITFAVIAFVMMLGLDFFQRQSAESNGEFGASEYFALITDGLGNVRVALLGENKNEGTDVTISALGDEYSSVSRAEVGIDVNSVQGVVSSGGSNGERVEDEGHASVQSPSQRGTKPKVRRLGIGSCSSNGFSKRCFVNSK